MAGAVPRTLRPDLPRPAELFKFQENGIGPGHPARPRRTDPPGNALPVRRRRAGVLDQPAPVPSGRRPGRRVPHRGSHRLVDPEGLRAQPQDPPVLVHPPRRKLTGPISASAKKALTTKGTKNTKRKIKKNIRPRAG